MFQLLVDKPPNPIVYNSCIIFLAPSGLFRYSRNIGVIMYDVHAKKKYKMLYTARHVECRLTEKVDFWSVQYNCPNSPSLISLRKVSVCYQLAKSCVRPSSVIS